MPTENFNGDIVRGLLRRKPDLDIVRVQDVALSGAGDHAVLEWAATQGRVLVTHDVSTLTKHAYDRVASGKRRPGVFDARSTAAIGQSIDDLILVVECSHEGEWEGQVRGLYEKLPSAARNSVPCDGSPTVLTVTVG